MLERHEIERLLAAAPGPYRLIIATTNRHQPVDGGVVASAHAAPPDRVLGRMTPASIAAGA